MSSNRAAMWYCHECHAEMRPLMVPDPHCASCNGTFVEEIEANGTDDPRQFDHEIEGGDGIDPNHPAVGFPFNILFPQMPPPPRTGNGFRVEFRSGPGGERRIAFGNPAGPGLDEGGPRDPFLALLAALAAPSPPGSPTLPQDPNDPRQLIQRYVAAMLGGGGGPIIFGPGGPGQGGQNGQWGDYALNQEALDQIVTQLMEATGNAHRPNPAPEDMIADLPRTKLTESCSLVTSGQSCAICTEVFAPPSADSESGSSSTSALTLPCAHTFHDECVITWLKTSGTCPVCRHQLVAQPTHEPRPAGGAVPPPMFGGATARESGVGGSANAPSADSTGAGAGRANGSLADLLSSVFGRPSANADGPSNTQGGRQSPPSDRSTPPPPLEPMSSDSSLDERNPPARRTSPPHDSQTHARSSSSGGSGSGGGSGSSGGLGFGAAAGMAGRWLSQAAHTVTGHHHSSSSSSSSRGNPATSNPAERRAGEAADRRVAAEAAERRAREGREAREDRDSAIQSGYPGAGARAQSPPGGDTGSRTTGANRQPTRNGPSGPHYFDPDVDLD